MNTIEQLMNLVVNKGQSPSFANHVDAVSNGSLVAWALQGAVMVGYDSKLYVFQADSLAEAKENVTFTAYALTRTVNEENEEQIMSMRENLKPLTEEAFQRVTTIAGTPMLMLEQTADDIETLNKQMKD